MYLYYEYRGLYVYMYHIGIEETQEGISNFLWLLPLGRHCLHYTLLNFLKMDLSGIDRNENRGESKLEHSAIFCCSCDRKCTKLGVRRPGVLVLVLPIALRSQWPSQNLGFLTYKMMTFRGIPNVTLCDDKHTQRKASCVASRSVMVSFK